MNTNPRFHINAVRSLGLSINSNVLSLQWNSSENHSIHTVGDFYLDLLVSTVRRNNYHYYLFIVFISNARPKYWFRSSRFINPPAVFMRPIDQCSSGRSFMWVGYLQEPRKTLPEKITTDCCFCSFVLYLHGKISLSRSYKAPWH